MAVELPSSESELHSLLSSAVASRAPQIRKESETMTLATVRRILETDLELEKFALDPHKSKIRKLVDEVLLNAENTEAQEGDGTETTEGADVIESDQSMKEKPAKKSSQKVSRKKAREETEEHSDGSQNEDSYTEAPKRKKQKKEKKEKAQSEDEDSYAEAPKKKKQKKEKKERAPLSEDDGEVSEDSEEKKPKKASKAPAVKPTQDKKIEHLKKVIKACGLGIPPAIYKKAKQLPSEKYSSYLRKELEGILSRHGLSSDPSEKEIKAAKRKIAREKDLEGIDTTNIITEPRGRRAASNFFSPVYKPPTVAHDSEEDENSESEDESSDSGDEKMDSEEEGKIDDKDEGTEGVSGKEEKSVTVEKDAEDKEEKSSAEDTKCDDKSENAENTQKSENTENTGKTENVEMTDAKEDNGGSVSGDDGKKPDVAEKSD